MTLQEYVNTLKDKRIAVIGIGVSNEPLIELLLKNGCYVTACDKRTMQEMGDEGRKLKAMGAELCLGEDYLEHLDQDVIFRTPGLMPFDEHLEKAKARGAVVTSEMEVFMSLCPCRTIAITGSDGKTTTSTIISELLKAAGYRVHLGGNIGHPLLCETPDIRPDDVTVLELSSFQLHSMKCAPDVAVITNIGFSHIESLGSQQNILRAKLEIIDGLKKDGVPTQDSFSIRTMDIQNITRAFPKHIYPISRISTRSRTVPPRSTALSTAYMTECQGR